MSPTDPAPSVLIVDDDPDDLFMTKRLLLKAGVKHGIVSLRSGEETLGYQKGCCATDVPPCLMVLDIKMPQVTGFEVLAWVRKQSALQRTKIYMLSGSDEPVDRTRAGELGADGYLVKHPPASVLTEILERACAGG
jgi:CheY-like chemotaxis protein